MATGHFIKAGLRHLLLVITLSGLVACKLEPDSTATSSIATDVVLHERRRTAGHDGD
jgi:hypothetical protein